MDKAMKPKEIVQALRCCVFGVPCQNCPEASNDHCMDDVHMFAADLIERLTAENAVLPDGQASAIETLHKEIEWKDMVIALAQREQAKAEAERDALLEIAKQGKDCKTCKNNEECVQPGIDGAHRCDRCVEKCPCYGREGGHWEWRGLPGAPEEGDHHEPKT
jgi:hypothetical protein